MKQDLQKMVRELSNAIDALPDDSLYPKEKFMRYYTGTLFELGASECFELIEKALKNINIYSPLVMVGALATVRAEVGRNFKPIEEMTLNQKLDILKSSSLYPKQVNEHNALADATWNFELYKFLKKITDPLITYYENSHQPNA